MATEAERVRGSVPDLLDDVDDAGNEDAADHQNDESTDELVAELLPRRSPVFEQFTEIDHVVAFSVSCRTRECTSVQTPFELYRKRPS